MSNTDKTPLKEETTEKKTNKKPKTTKSAITIRQSRIRSTNTVPDSKLANLDKDHYKEKLKELKCRTYLVISVLIVFGLAAIGWYIAQLSNSASEQFEEVVSFLVIFVITFCLAFYGMYFSHRYGSINAQVELLNKLKTDLNIQNQKLENATDALKLEVNNVFKSVKPLDDTQNSLQKLLRVTSSITDLGQNIHCNNDDIKHLFNDIDNINKLIKELMKQQQKNDLIRIYYQLELRNDNKPGLNKKEYDYLLNRLDKKTADAFREITSFRKLDKNNNKVIEIQEFESVLDKIMENLDKNK